MRKAGPRAVVLLLLLSFGSTGWTLPAPPPESNSSVVAIGDVHGDFDHFVGILQRTALIDKQNHWAGGKNTLVQTGDLLDRGPKPREVMDLLMALEKESSKAGGRVVSLLGNHEVMNIMGDLRYVTPENYASFADAKSEERRRAAFKEYLKWRDGHAAIIAELRQPLELTEGEWMARHPLGYLEHRESFGLHGTYGKWLRTHAGLVELNGVVFLHGGISPAVSSIKLSDLNARIQEEISAFDSLKQYMVDQRLILPFFNLQEMTAVAEAALSAEKKSKVRSDPELESRISQFLRFPQWLCVRPDGPLWFRGYDQWSEEEGDAQVAKILEAFHANHIVVGHTVQKGGAVRVRFGGKVFLIDTGMLSSVYVGGRASALDIQNSAKFTAEYMEQQEVLLEPQKVSWSNTAPEQLSAVQ
jgi:hypothetical protein